MIRSARLVQAASEAPSVPAVEPVRDRESLPWDESRPAGTSGGGGAISGGDRRALAWVAGVAAVLGLINALSAAHDGTRNGGPYQLGLQLFWQVTSLAVMVALAPLVWRGTRQVMRLRTWPTRVVRAGAGAMLFSTAHVAGMVALRSVAFAAFGTTYRFGWSLSELAYEARKDLVTCLLLGGVFWLIDSRRAAARALTASQIARSKPAVPPSSDPPSGLWLRDGTTSIRVEPQAIVTVVSAGNYVEYRLQGGATHLIRGTLAGEEGRLAAFRIARVHRTRLVNLAHVVRVEPRPSGDFDLTLDTGERVSGSRRYRSAVGALAGGAAA